MDPLYIPVIVLSIGGLFAFWGLLVLLIRFFRRQGENRRGERDLPRE